MGDLQNIRHDSPHNLLFSGASGTTLAMAPEIARFSLGLAPENLDKAAGAFGAPIPGKVGGMARTGQSFSLCLGPDEWQLMVPMALANPLAKNFAHLRAEVPHSLVDITHRQIGLIISGPLASAIIGAGCPLDLSEMPVNGCARSVLDKVQVIIMKTDEYTYHLEIMRSFVPFAGQFLRNAANQYEAELALNTTP